MASKSQRPGPSRPPLSPVLLGVQNREQLSLFRLLSALYGYTLYCKALAKQLDFSLQFSPNFAITHILERVSAKNICHHKYLPAQ